MLGGGSIHTKRHLLQDALKKMGAAIFDGMRVLRPRSAVSLFIRQLTGKKQAFWSYPLDFGALLIYVASYKK